MPLDIDQFEDGAPLRTPPTSERLIRFLLAHDEQAFTRQELADAIDAAPETVGTNLTRLKDRGLLRHREPYWAITDDHEHARAVLQRRFDDEMITELRRLADWDDWPERRTSTVERDSTSTDGSEQTSETDHSASSASTDEATRSSTHRTAATEYVDRVRTGVDDAVEQLSLFGSVARDEATAGSDVDVFVVVSDDADFASVDDQLLDIAYDVQLEYGVRIEVHSLTAHEFETRTQRGDPFLRTVLEAGEQCV